jgi:hypothetical protein
MILEEDEQWADNGEIIKIPSQGKKHGWKMISKQEVSHNGNPQLRFKNIHGSVQVGKLNC